jgi:tagatose-1,6-bisphosphate aldolase
MSLMTTSELRGYQQICGADGNILVIACDQRGSMRKLLARDESAQKNITDAQLGDVKSDVVQYLAAHAPCVLLDPACAVPRVVDEGVLPRDVALLVGLDATGHDTSPEGYYISRLVPGISARRVRELGGTGGKLLVYLRPDRPQANPGNLDLVRQCVADFAAEDLLLVVEFLTYALPGEDPAAYKERFPALIEQGARLCLEAGAKVLKIPYPGTAEACAAVTRLAGQVPWSVLSAGVDHATFLGQVEIAMANGASGIIAGRSLWKDCVSLDRDTTRRLLQERAVPRLRELQSVLKKHSRKIATRT